ncbi:VOC family protein [Actinophytocola sp. NPDC049390]|uniref:VOC family protein n=1 Tax=Actinophytocola sp. NPDC049390 TaxID=3363894 RepID=UPI0037AB3A4C
MITSLTHTTVYVLDQDSAKAFYTEKLGFRVGEDLVMGEGFDGAGQGFRWLTVIPPGQPDVRFVLADCRMGHAPEHAETIRELVAKGAMGSAVLATDDCHGTFKNCRRVASSSSPNPPSGPTASKPPSATTPATSTASPRRCGGRKTGKRR